jgi:hypothetical protein
LEARGGIEPPIKVLQTFALPLGERAPVLPVATQKNWQTKNEKTHLPFSFWRWVSKTDGLISMN